MKGILVTSVIGGTGKKYVMYVSFCLQPSSTLGLIYIRPSSNLLGQITLY